MRYGSACLREFVSGTAGFRIAFCCGPPERCAEIIIVLCMHCNIAVMLPQLQPSSSSNGRSGCDRACSAAALVDALCVSQEGMWAWCQLQQCVGLGVLTTHKAGSKPVLAAASCVARNFKCSAPMCGRSVNGPIVAPRSKLSLLEQLGGLQLVCSMCWACVCAGM